VSDRPSPEKLYNDFAAYLRSQGLETEARRIERRGAKLQQQTAEDEKWMENHDRWRRLYNVQEARRMARAEWRERHRWLVIIGTSVGIVAAVVLMLAIGVGWGLILRGVCR